jgi:DNA-binding NarL/FixJ family response regulator
MVRVVKTPIAPSTVSRLLASALRKLNLQSKVELASMGFRKNDPKGAQRNR